ncbi:MAG TPA: cytidylate kinase-like family protein [Gemmatimonadaceae bacterium]
MHRPVRLITISREFGAGGSELARALGERLAWPVLDQDIVQRVATRMQLDAGTVERFDEHPPSLLARIATVLIVPQPDIYSFPTQSDVPDHDTIARATRRVIEEAAETLPLVVVGHGAQCIFGDRGDVIHVRVIAPVAARVRLIVERMRVESAFASTLARRADHDRQTYMQRYFHQDWRNELLYDLQINTGRTSIADAVQLIAELVRLREAAEQPAEVAQ